MIHPLPSRVVVRRHRALFAGGVNILCLLYSMSDQYVLYWRWHETSMFSRHSLNIWLNQSCMLCMSSWYLACAIVEWCNLHWYQRYRGTCGQDLYAFLVFIGCDVGGYCPGSTLLTSHCQDDSKYLSCPTGRYSTTYNNSRLNQCLACSIGSYQVRSNITLI
jgi:hypothetical protein